MENRSWRIARRNGFTAIETVVTVVVLAILAAYATPKLFGLKEQADATEETLKIKDIEARHSQEMLKAGKRGSNPILGDVVGFRPEVVAEPAPDTAPMRVSYGYSFQFNPDQYGGSTGAMYISTGYPRDTSAQGGSGVWFDPDDDGISTCSELSSLDFRAKLMTIRGMVLGFFVGEDDSIRTSSTSSDRDLLLTDPIPRCRIERVAYRRWRTTVATGYVYQDIPELPTTSYKYMTENFFGDMPYGKNSAGRFFRTIAPNHFSYDCRSYSRSYGVQYVIKGSADARMNNKEHLTRAESAGLSIVFAVNSTDVEIVGSSPVQYDKVPNAINTSSHSSVHCERVGPAPAVPPSDPGDPGVYPMAADGSGYCLSPGRKLPTYKDSAGTPTSSASDSVAELGTEAVDDLTNCPG